MKLHESTYNLAADICSIFDPEYKIQLRLSMFAAKSNPTVYRNNHTHYFYDTMPNNMISPLGETLRWAAEIIKFNKYYEIPEFNHYAQIIFGNQECFIDIITRIDEMQQNRMVDFNLAVILLRHKKSLTIIRTDIVDIWERLLSLIFDRYWIWDELHIITKYNLVKQLQDDLLRGKIRKCEREEKMKIMKYSEFYNYCVASTILDRWSEC